MKPEKFAELTLKISPLVNEELTRLRSINKGKEVLPQGRTSWHIVRMISFALERVMSGPHPEVFIPEYHIPWMTQVLLKKGTTENDVVLDTLDQSIYPVEPNMQLSFTKIDVLDQVFSSFSDAALFNWFVKNIDCVCEVLESIFKNAFSGSEQKDILILSNHATWFNLPLIAHCLHRIFKIPKEHIYTILGPAIMHGRFNRAGILRFSNGLKTNPDTPRAETGFEGIEDIRTHFMDELSGIIRTPNFSGYPRIFLLSPSGTTDTLSPEGKILLAEPSKGTNTLVKMLLKRMKLLGFVVGVNDTDIIKPGHSRPKMLGGRVFIKGGAVDEKTWKEELPRSILDKDGNEIGGWAE